jgi:hypothetical protein
MTVTKHALLQARLQGIRTTLDRAPANEKSHQASTALASGFNEIVDAIKKTYPELGESLPGPIQSTEPFRRIGKSNVTYLDLEVMCEQVLNLLRLVEP